jgi:hypothetical protein
MSAMCVCVSVYVSGGAGGVREAYKGKGEDYQLFWPEKSGRHPTPCARL